MVVVAIDQLLGFMSSGLEAPSQAASTPPPTMDMTQAVAALSHPASGGPTTLHLVLASVIGLVAGGAGGWLAATIDDDSLAAKTLSFLLVFSALVSAGLASMAGYNDYAITWILGGILQGVGCFMAGHLKYG